MTFQLRIGPNILNILFSSSRTIEYFCITSNLLLNLNLAELYHIELFVFRISNLFRKVYLLQHETKLYVTAYVNFTMYKETFIINLIIRELAVLCPPVSGVKNLSQSL